MMSEHNIWRSLLYVSASQPARIDKALAGDADCVIVDLEDSVPPPAKATARLHALQVDVRGRDVLVRINRLDDDLGWQDLSDLAACEFAGFRIPKAEDPETIRAAGNMLDSAGSGAGLYLLLESAVGVARASELAQAHRRVMGLSIGEADLLADLGASDRTSLDHARSTVVLASRVAGLQAPPASVYIHLDDLDGLIRTSHRARGWGFFGRSVIHPRQVGPVNEVFTPTADEVAQAKVLLRGLAEASSKGSASLVLPDGRFVDPAVARAAMRTVRLAEVFSIQGDQRHQPGSRGA
jgi:citrate lyase subunit beta/citryl-CoA lyase